MLDLPKEYNIYVYTTFNNKTDKTNVLVANKERTKVVPDIREQCNGKYLITMLYQIENLIFDQLVAAVDTHPPDKINITFYRYKDKNMGDCLDRIVRIVEQTDMLDPIHHPQFIEGALKWKNHTKPKTYWVMLSIINKILLVKTKCPITIEHFRTHDSISDIAWKMIK